MKNKEIIESAFGEALVWEELPDNKMSRIKIEMPSVNLFKEFDWKSMNEFIVSNLPKFENAIQPYIKDLK